jgi:hypothetical protein
VWIATLNIRNGDLFPLVFCFVPDAVADTGKDV